MKAKKQSYLQIGQFVLDKSDIIGVFDFDKITVFKVNRNYLSNAQKNDKIINMADDLPKSCIVCCEKNLDSEKVYLCSFLTATLFKRNAAVDL